MKVIHFPHAKATHCDHGVSIARHCWDCESEWFRRRGLGCFRGWIIVLLLALPFWWLIFLWLIGG